MENSPTKSQLLESIRNNFQVWEESLKQMDDSQMAQAKIGEWTVKDVIAHITWHEKEMVGLIQAHALVGSPWWDLPTDQRNQLIYEENKDRLLNEVREEANLAHGQLIQLVEALPEGDLYDPASFPGMPPDWQPVILIVQNTYEHYQNHLHNLMAYLDEHIDL